MRQYCLKREELLVIRGGVQRVIKPGDVIFIPPGVPRVIRDTAGISYLNIHFGGTD